MKKSYEKELNNGEEYLDWLRKNPGRKPLAAIVEDGKIFLRGELSGEQLEEVRIASRYNNSLVKTFVNDRSNNLIEGVPDEYKDEMKKVVDEIRSLLETVKVKQEQQKTNRKENKKTKAEKRQEWLLQYLKYWLQKERRIPKSNLGGSPQEQLENRFSIQLRQEGIWDMVYGDKEFPKHLEKLMQEIKGKIREINSKENKEIGGK